MSARSNRFNSSAQEPNVAVTTPPPLAKMWFYVIHSIMLSTAAPLFALVSFITYFCTPSYGFGFVIGLYFFVVFFWPGTAYVNEIGAYFVLPNSTKKHKTLGEIFKRIAISTSFMCCVVFATSLIQNQIILNQNISNAVNEFVAYLTPPMPIFWVTLWSNAEPTGTVFPNASGVLRVLKMSIAYGVLFIIHFVGLGLIPQYLAQWWKAVKNSAVELWRLEQNRAQQRNE